MGDFYPSPQQDIFCLLQSLDDAAGLADGVAPAGLLSEEERGRYEMFRVPKRRRDWLLGRWTAKHLVRAYLSKKGRPTPLDEIIIRADPDGAPYAALRSERLRLSLSISHSGAFSFCALTDQPGATVGADLEMIEPRPLSLVEQFFTPEEQTAALARPPSERDLWITLVWSAKEAFLKCIREGLRVDTRAVTVELPQEGSAAEGWLPLTVSARADLLAIGSAYRGWWRREAGFVVTIGLLDGG